MKDQQLNNRCEAIPHLAETPEELPFHLVSDLDNATSSATSLQRMGGVLGFCLAVIATYYEASLGYDFAASFGITNPKADKLARIMFGGGTAVPAIALVGLPTYDYIVNVLDFTASSSPQLQVKYPYVLKALNIVSQILSLPSGVPFSYQVAVTASPDLPLQILTAGSCFFISFICSKQGLERFYLRQFLKKYRIEDDETKIKREQLTVALGHLIRRARTIDKSLIRYLSYYYKNHLDEKDFDTNFFQRVRTLFDLDNMLQTEPRQISHAKIKTGFTYVAGALGVVATSTMYVLTLQAGDWFCDKVAIYNSTDRNALKHSLALTCSSSIGFFMADAAMQSFQEYLAYFLGNDSLLNTEVSHPRIRKAINWFSLFIGIFASTPNFELSIKQDSNYEYDIPVLAGQTLSLILAINLFLQMSVSYIDKKFYGDTDDAKRDFFIQRFTVLTEKVNWQYTPKEIDFLHTTLIKPATLREIVVDEKVNQESSLQPNSLFKYVPTSSDEKSYPANSTLNFRR